MPRLIQNFGPCSSNLEIRNFYLFVGACIYLQGPFLSGLVLVCFVNTTVVVDSQFFLSSIFSFLYFQNVNVCVSFFILFLFLIFDSLILSLSYIKISIVNQIQNVAQFHTFCMLLSGLFEYCRHPIKKRTDAKQKDCYRVSKDFELS